MAWHIPFEKLLLLADRGLKSPVPDTGSWKQWFCISIKAEVLLVLALTKEVSSSVAYPGGWQLCCLPMRLAALLPT
jgi:hypothetical protein